MTSLSFPASVVDLCNSIPFYRCPNLIEITISADNPIYDSRNNSNAIIEKATNTLIAGIKTTTIPNTVTAIGEKAFYKCDGLSSIDIPNSVLSIGEKAFYKCIGLTNIISEIENPFSINNNVFTSDSATLYVPAGTKSLYEATEGWNKLSNIVEMEPTVYNDGDIFFSANADGIQLKYQVISTADKTVKVIDSKLLDNGPNTQATNATHISIPEEVEGFTVVAIESFIFQDWDNLETMTLPNTVKDLGSGTFHFCSNLRSINIPEGVSEIGGELFSGCTNLQSINIPSTVLSIKGEAFEGCESLQNLVIPEGVQSIGREAFRKCTSLTSIAIPSSVNLIKSGAFGSCSNLTHISVASGNTIYDSREDCNGIIETSTNTLIYGCRITTIPQSVTAIGDGAFSSSDITSTVIPSQIISIGEDAFYGCTSLTNVTISENVTEIGDYAFADCIALTEVISMISTPFAIDESVFGRDKYMNQPLSATLYVPEGSKALYETTTGWNQFQNIVEMEEEQAQAIEIDGIYYEIANAGIALKDIQQNVYPSDVEVAVVVASPNKEYNGDVVIPSAITYDGKTYAVALIGEGAFAEYKGEYGYDLRSVVIPNSVVAIAYEAFVESSTLERVEIPNSVTFIGENAFGDCESLSSIHLPDNLTEIAAKTFKYCTSLTEIEIPAGVESIGKRAFGNCDNLTTIISHIAEPFDIDINAFGIYDSNRNWIANPNTTLYIPWGTKALYEAANGWKEFARIVEPKLSSGDSFVASIIVNDESADATFVVADSDNNYVCVGNGEPSSIDEWTEGSIVIPHTVVGSDGIEYQVKGLSDMAFFGCYAINSITMPEGITNIGNTAFYQCTELTSVSLPESLQSIGEEAFLFCENLPEVIIPQNVTSIGLSAFYGCDNLTEVTVAWTEPIAIDEECFSNAANATLYVPAGTKAAYKAATGWKNFGRIVEMGEESEEDTDISQMDNVIYIEPVEVRTGTETILSFKMKNTASIRSFGFDLYLPDGITAIPNSSGKPWGSLNYNRVPKDEDGYPLHKMTLSYQEGNVIRFLCDAQEGQTFIGNVGEIATLKVKISETMAEGNYPIILKKVKLSETDIANYYLTEELKSKITILSYILGDINNDGFVDVSDYSGVADRIHGRTPAGFNEKAGDVDENGIIDVSDYSGVANLIHYGSIHGKQNSPSKTNNINDVEPQ